MTSKKAGQHGYEKAGARYWIKLILTYLLMPLVLLIIGWDLAWWQGWLYSVLFLVIGMGSRVLAEKRHPGLMAERSKFGKDQNVKPWDKVLAPLMAISLSFPLFIVAGLDHHFGWSPEFPIWLNILGFILITFGYVFASWAIIENRFFSSVTRIQKERGHVVCDSGPYQDCKTSWLCWKYSGTTGHCAGFRFCLDNHSSDSSADHCRDKDRAGR